MSDSDPQRRRDRGQAVVELALCLPLVCMLLLGAVQVAIVVREQLLVQHVAREAARAAAVSAAPGAAASRAAAAIDRRVAVDVGATTTRVRVRAQLVVRTDVALIGPLLPDITVEATATMGREPPP